MTDARLKLICVAGSFLIGGCERHGETTTAPPARPRIALVMKSLSNEFFGTMAEGAMAYHAQHDDAYDLTVDGIKNETDLAGQIALVERMIAKHVDAIVIAPADSKALVPVLRRAIGEGLAVVNIDNRLDPQTLQMAQIKIPFVGPDNRAGAAAVGRVVAARLAKGDQVAIIEGIPTADNGRQRRLGFEDAIGAAGLDLVAVRSGNWEMESARTEAGALLGSHPGLRAIFCANDTMALGAVAAIGIAGRQGRVLVAGFDDINAIKPFLQSGAVAATADQHGDLLAVFGIDAALEILQTKLASDRTTPVDVITK